MSEIVESGQPEKQAQETAPTSEDNGDEQSSQPQFVSREEFNELQKFVRGLQGKGDKTASTVEKVLEQIGTFQLSAEERAEVVNNLRPEPEQEKLEPAPVEEPQLDDIVQKVVAAIQEMPSGESIATPGGGNLPPSNATASEAKVELAAIQEAKPRSQRTKAEQERVAELMDIIRAEEG